MIFCIIASKPSYQYLPAIDGLRFYVVLLILANHISLNKHLEGHGLFFTLTGFLIHHITLSELKHNIYSFKNYMMRRIIRTLPLYFLIVVVFGLTQLLLQATNLHVTLNDYWKYLLVIPNFSFEPNNFILTNLWAVGVTEQFYLTWGIIILIVRKWTSLILVSILAIVYFLLLAFPQLVFYGNPLVYFPNFLTGALFAHFYNTYPKQELLSGFLANKFIVIIILLTSVLFFAFSFSNSFINQYYLLRQILLSINFGVIILLVCYTSFNKIFVAKSIRYFGKISYSFYCLHSIVLVGFIVVLRKLNYPVNVISRYFMVLIVSLLLAHLSYIYFEKKILTLKRFFYK